MRREHLRKGTGIARKQPTFVPNNIERLPERLAVMQDTRDAQPVAVGQHDGRDDRNPMSGLRKREEVGRRATFDQDMGLKPSETAGRIESLTNQKSAVKQQQRMRSEAANVYGTSEF